MHTGGGKDEEDAYFPLHSRLSHLNMASLGFVCEREKQDRIFPRLDLRLGWIAAALKADPQSNVSGKKL